MVPVSLNPYICTCLDQDLGTFMDQIQNAVNTQSPMNCPYDQENPSSTEKVPEKVKCNSLHVPVCNVQCSHPLNRLCKANYFHTQRTWGTCCRGLSSVDSKLLARASGASGGDNCDKRIVCGGVGNKPATPDLSPGTKLPSHGITFICCHHSVLKNSSDRTAYHHADVIYFVTSFIKSKCTVRKTHALHQH